MPARILAVVGTGTGVGKTVVTRRLRDDLRSRGIEAMCVKPFVSGRRPDGTWQDLVELECDAAARFVAPLAPLAAARAGEDPADLEGAAEFVRVKAAAMSGGWLLVEGIGGVMVPLAPGVTWLDWHQKAGWPALVVAAAGLGTINHSLLAIAALRDRAIRVPAFVLSETAPLPEGTAESNAALIAEFSGVVPLGILHYDASEVAPGHWGDATTPRLEDYVG